MKVQCIRVVCNCHFWIVTVRVLITSTRNISDLHSESAEMFYFRKKFAHSRQREPYLLVRHKDSICLVQQLFSFTIFNTKQEDVH